MVHSSHTEANKTQRQILKETQKNHILKTLRNYIRSSETELSVKIGRVRLIILILISKLINQI